jgi:AmmeMemoRadiSam system protein B
VKIVPIGVSPVENSFEIGKAVVEIATSLGLEVKVIGSTDLTHYGFNYGFTPKGTGPAALKWVRHENDRKVIEAMLALEPVAVISEAQARQNACCAGAAATAIAASKQLGAEKAELIAYATSYDKSPGDSFVGYTGIVFLKD